MVDLLLWRRLTEHTDFAAITGKAAPSGTGGGAMHIPIGVNSTQLPIVSFLGNPINTNVIINTEPNPPKVPAAALIFDGNPSRRSGEWRIADQFHHRHPAWSPAVGFPTTYDPKNRPIVFVVRSGDKYHARFSNEKTLKGASPSLFARINQRRNSGIAPLDPSWSAALGVSPHVDTLAAYEELAESPEAETATAFNPKNVVDGRKKTIAEVVRRQGQRSFRKKLLKGYEGRCAISGCEVEVTLEAAHITPYRGPDTNHPSNGILLRADLHTLLDLGLISINPKSMKVMVSSLLDGTEYAKLEGKIIAVPKDAKLRPSAAALAEHNDIFQK